MRTYLVSEEGAPAFERFARGLLRPLFDEVGLSASASDGDERRALRGTVIAALGTVGNDPDVVAKARAALDRALADGPALDATAAGAITRTAAAHGNAALFDALRAAAERSTSPEDQYRYLYALGDFKEPPLIERGLQYALSPQLRSQDTALYLARFLANPTARARAWEFVKDHWGTLESKITIALGDVNLAHALAGFCDAGSRADIAAFFREHPLPGATRTLDQTFEQIDTCIAVRTAQTPALAAWLAGR
jgi:hypothetical protein